MGRFHVLAREGRQALAVGDSERARERLGAALELWRGEPLAEFAYVPFAQRVVPGIQEARLAAVEDRIDADLALGGEGELISEIESLIALSPLQERLRVFAAAAGVSTDYDNAPRPPYVAVRDRLRQVGRAQRLGARGIAADR